MVVDVRLRELPRVAGDHARTLWPGTALAARCRTRGSRNSPCCCSVSLICPYLSSSKFTPMCAVKP